MISASKKFVNLNKILKLFNQTHLTFHNKSYFSKLPPIWNNSISFQTKNKLSVQFILNGAIIKSIQKQQYSNQKSFQHVRIIPQNNSLLLTIAKSNEVFLKNAQRYIYSLSIINALKLGLWNSQINGSQFVCNTLNLKQNFNQQKLLIRQKHIKTQQESNSLSNKQFNFFFLNQQSKVSINFTLQKNNFDMVQNVIQSCMKKMNGWQDYFKIERRLKLQQADMVFKYAPSSQSQ